MGHLFDAGLEIWRFFLRLRNRSIVVWRRLQHRWMPARSFAPRFSIVSPVYDVGRYLETYFVSIIIQKRFCTDVELIVVDDGSKDTSAAILEKWRRRFPRNITVIRQSNGGQSVARNTGLRHATADWVTFIDPDDFVERDYLERVARFIRRHDTAQDPLNFVSCRHITYNEANRRFLDNHPLRSRFKEDAVLPVSDPGKFIQLHVNSVFFKRSLIEGSLLRFDARVKPCFEDAHFVARYMMGCTSGSIGFVRGARYYYRKRADNSSALDTSGDAPERFDDLYRYGYCAVLEEARRRLGTVPRWLQRTVLYEVVWQIRRFLDGEEKLAFLSPSQLNTYKSHLEEVFQGIDKETIAGFDLAGIRELHRIGLLGAYKAAHKRRSYCFINWLDAERGEFELRWYSARAATRAVIRIDGEEAEPSDTKLQVHTLFGQPFHYESRVRVRRTAGMLTVEVDGVAYTIDVFGNRAIPSIDLTRMFRDHGVVQPPVDLSRRALRVRRESQSAAVRQRYAAAWMFIDRDVHADDNAEHLYRYVRRIRPDINAYFVLRRDSMDWPRLAKEGFRLVPFGSTEHEYLLLNARFLISSHADRYVWNFMPAREYRDLLQFKFVFLQHGVLVSDLATWLNNVPIDLMLSSTEREYQSMVGPSTRYKLTASQVALTGLPRHDALLRDSEQSERHIVIMPTWRISLVGPRLGQSTNRALNADFDRTAYAIAWKSFLHAPRLKAMAERHGYRVTLFPHPNIVPYLHCFEVPDWIDVQTRTAGHSIQAAFKRARLMVTDYSSVAFEMAVLGRGVLYYQFDRDQFYEGLHISREGYFDFERDGFGPVCRDLNDLLGNLERALESGGQLDLAYRARARAVFRWRDGNACRRALQAIEALRQPSVLRAFEWHPAREPSDAEPVAQLSRMGS